MTDIVTWEQVAEYAEADMVGGKLYKKWTLLGEKVGSQFNFTADGEAVVQEILASRRKPAKAEKPFTPGLD